MSTTMLVTRHIQDHNEANTTLWTYFGYPSRVMPCTSDAGTCEYLAAVYWMHSVSVLYTFILWAVIGGILALWIGYRILRSNHRQAEIKTPFDRGFGALETAGRRCLLPEAPLRRFFGRVTRLQVAVLACLLGYLLIFSLVGIVYKTWVTPVKKSPGFYNTRTGLGGFADRVGALAFALTPLTVALAQRESILSLVTGIPHQHLNFLHRWTGYVIFIQSFLHTLGWTIVEAKLYQPQPSVYKTFIAEQYIIFGIVAMLFVTALTVLSTRWAIRLTGYEVFRKLHWGFAALYLGACWGHWDKLAFWMYASIIILFLDQGLRLFRTLLIHTGLRKGSARGLGFRCATATLRHFGAREEDSLVRLDFDFEHGPWRPGQHFYLCFPTLGIWQSHPLTPSSSPVDGRLQHHTYLIRTRGGITAQMASLAQQGGTATTPVILSGPYGRGFDGVGSQNLLAVAGGSGVTFALPLVMEASARKGSHAVELVWAVRYTRDLEWLGGELGALKKGLAVQELARLRVRVFVTREDGSSSDADYSEGEKEKDFGGVSDSDSDSASSSTEASGVADIVSELPGFSVTYMAGRQPCVEEIVADFAERAAIVGGSSLVVGSGPEGLGTDLRAAVAKRNQPGKVWAGDAEGEWGMYWDSRE